MKALKISPNFSINDIHNLRLYIAEKYSSMSKEEADKDFNFHYQSAKEAIESFRKKNEKSIEKIG
jgi:transposase